MKRKIFVLSYLMLIAAITLGCTSTESTETVQDDAPSIIEKAMDQGELALADGDIEKAKSNFNLALTKDANNKEAKEWLEIIEKYDQLVSHLENKDIDNATKTVNELRSNGKYAVIAGLTTEHEQNLDKMTAEVKELDTKIVELGELYNPEDESSMPNETYLARADEILKNPYLTDEQKKTVENFKKEATDRVNSILAREEEKQKAANLEEQQNNDPYEWGPGIKEQFESEMVERGYADSAATIRYEKLHVYNNQGFYEVYAEMDGVEHRIVSVNVKTGDFHG